MFVLVLQKSVANKMLGLIRYFEQSLSKESVYEEQKPAYSWGTVERETVAKTFLSLCTRVQDLLAAEARLVEMESPVYILGQLFAWLRQCYCVLVVQGQHSQPGVHIQLAITYYYSINYNCSCNTPAQYYIHLVQKLSCS